MGKRFVITASKLLRKTAFQDEELRNDSTFFCSELVAAAY